MSTVGVITGLKSEADCLDPLMSFDPAPVVRCAGARPHRVPDLVSGMLELGCRGIVSFGVTGALVDDLQSGDIVVPASVVSAAGEAWPTDTAWREEIVRALEEAKCPVNAGECLLGSDAALTSPADKTRANASTGAVVVDMESQAVALATHVAGVPFVVVRVVADDADTAVPAAAMDAVRPDGSISLLPVISGLMVRPWTLGTYLKLGAANGRAMERLRGLVPVLGPGFRFPLG